jgi:hypothetical protein
MYDESKHHQVEGNAVGREWWLREHHGATVTPGRVRPDLLRGSARQDHDDHRRLAESGAGRDGRALAEPSREDSGRSDSDLLPVLGPARRHPAGTLPDGPRDRSPQCGHNVHQRHCARRPAHRPLVERLSAEVRFPSIRSHQARIDTRTFGSFLRNQCAASPHHRRCRR